MSLRFKGPINWDQAIIRTGMAKQLAKDVVRSRGGKCFCVSTVQTVSRGGQDETPWPFETMVFPEPGGRGLYHEAYDSKDQALTGHERIVELVRGGGELPASTVRGEFGVPSLTPEEWRNR